jgi:hypothetical protein
VHVVDFDREPAQPLAWPLLRKNGKAHVHLNVRFISHMSQCRGVK